MCVFTIIIDLSFHVFLFLFYFFTCHMIFAKAESSPTHTSLFFFLFSFLSQFKEKDTFKCRWLAAAAAADPPDNLLYGGWPTLRPVRAQCVCHLNLCIPPSSFLFFLFFLYFYFLFSLFAPHLLSLTRLIFFFLFLFPFGLRSFFSCWL